MGKSFLIETIYQAVSKAFNFHAGSPDLQKVLKIAPTCIASINIDGTIINTALGIPIHVNLFSSPKLSDTLRCSLRQKYSELKLVIVDEISMVSNVRIQHIHARLCEIFNTSFEVPFAGVSVILVGDLYWLPPICQQMIFKDFKEELHDLTHPWKKFTFFELVEVMRQQGDLEFNSFE